MSDSPPAVAAPSLLFLDLDGTLISVSSEKEFLQHLVGRGRLSGWAFVRWMANYALHPVRSLREGKGWNRTYLKNLRPEVAESEASSFSADVLTDRVRPELLRILTRWRRDGTEVVLMTSSLRWLAEPVGAVAGATKVIASDPQVVDGRLTGRLAGPRPWGRTKRILAEEVLKNRDISPQDCIAAGDSWADRYLMSYCGGSLAVHPSRRLERLARKEGWSVMRGRHTRWA